MTLVPDPFYNGPHKPYLEKVIHPFQDASAATILPYESDEVDIAGVDVTDLERILRDPALKDELVRFHAMNTWWKKPPPNWIPSNAPNYTATPRPSWLKIIRPPSCITTSASNSVNPG